MLETSRLLLLRPTDADVELLAAVIGDGEVMRFIGGGDTGSRAAAVEQAAAMQRAWQVDGFGRFILVRKQDARRVGHAGLVSWDPLLWRSGLRAEIGDGAEIELGWTLLRDAWGAGLATEAALAIRDWAFAGVRPPRLISLIHPDNSRSARVATKIGARQEGIVTTQRGQPADLWVTAPLAGGLEAAPDRVR